jgi:hypothetical protein
LVHSTTLPYKKDHIADEKFHSDGSELHEIVSKLKEHDWYKQNPAIQKLNRLELKKEDDSTLFIIGRNILQTANGGEFAAISIIRNLNSWLTERFPEGDYHVLNGILFEIYFNSKGQFRYKDFKNTYIENIFELISIKKFKKSFDFIETQLIPFRKHLYYIPSSPAKTFPVEIIFKEFLY